MQFTSNVGKLECVCGGKVRISQLRFGSDVLIDL